MRDLLEFRAEFPTLEHTTYLISHSLAPMPRRAEERLAEYARTWRERGIRAWAEGWWEMPVTVGDQVGRIIGAPPGSTVMHQNVAIAEAVVLSCFLPPDRRRNRIVYEQGNFPSVRYLYQAQKDLDVVVCENDAAIVEAIDERTLLVPISHVLFRSGEIQDVAPIIRRAHDVGAHVILDCYQSAGIVPLDVDRARRRLRRRRLGEVALRWAWQRLALRASGSRRPPHAARDRLAGPCAAVRVRGGDGLRRGRHSVPHRYAECAGALRGNRRLRPDRGNRRAADPGELPTPDATPDRARR